MNTYRSTDRDADRGGAATTECTLGVIRARAAVVATGRAFVAVVTVTVTTTRVAQVELWRGRDFASALSKVLGDGGTRGDRV